MRHRWLLTVAVSAVLLAALTAACGDDGKDGGAEQPTATASSAVAPTATAGGPGTPAAGAVSVNLSEYIVFPDVDAFPAGTVAFNAKNIGGTQHELAVIGTELAPDALPVNDDGSIDEAAAELTVLGRTAKLDPQGGEQALTLDLSPGTYVLACNIVQDRPGREPVSHYHEGMRAAFEVTE